MGVKVNLLGVDIDGITMDGAVEAAIGLIRSRGGKTPYVVTPNPEILAACQSDAKVLEALRGAELSLPDGVGVVIGARLTGERLRERVPGVDFAALLMRRLAATGGSVYLLGGTENVAAAAAEKIAARFPGIKVAGYRNGYFQPGEEAEVVSAIKALSPDFLLVCLGSPKQELWMARHAPDSPAGLMAGLGGTLDVLSGEKKRAPEIFQRMGLEWLYRLAREPKRIWRVLKIPGFFVLVLRQRSKNDTNKG